MRASGTQKHRRRQHPDRVKYDRAVERLRRENEIELTLEQMLIKLQQQWGGEGGEIVYLLGCEDGMWELEVGDQSFQGRTPRAAILQAFREGQEKAS